MSRANFASEISAGAPYWALNTSSTPAWEDRRDLQGGLSAVLDIADTTYITVSATGVRNLAPVSGVITSANRFRKCPALWKPPVDANWTEHYADFILTWVWTSDPAVNTRIYTAIISHIDGATNTTNSGHTYFASIGRAASGTDLYQVQLGRAYGDDGDNGASSAQTLDSTLTASFDASTVGLVNGDKLRLRVRKRVSGSTIYFRWWLYRIGASLPASEDDYAAAGTLIARAGGDDTSEVSYASTAAHAVATRIGFANNTDATAIAIDTLWVEVLQYSQPTINVNTNYPTSVNVLKQADDWDYTIVDLGRGGNVNSFTTTLTPPTGCTAEIVSDFGVGNTATFRFRANSGATVSNGQTLGISATDGIIGTPATVNLTLNVKAIPGAAGALSYILGDHADRVLVGSSSDELSAADIASAATTRYGGTNAWTPNNLSGEAGGNHAHTSGRVDESGANGWSKEATSGYFARALSYGNGIGARRAMGRIPASNSWSVAIATLKPHMKSWIARWLDMAYDFIGCEIGVRAQAVVSSSAATILNGVSPDGLTVSCSGAGLSGASGAYTSAHRLGIEYTSGVIEIRKVASYTVGADKVFVVSEAFVNKPSAVTNVWVVNSNECDNIEVINDTMANMATVGHADYYTNATFGTRFFFYRGWYELSKQYLTTLDLLHPSTAGRAVLGDDVTDAESDFILAKASVTITPSTPDPYTLLDNDPAVDFGATIAGTYFNVSTLPGTLQGAETGKWSRTSGTAATVHADTGVVTPASAGSIVIKRSLPTWHTSTAVVPGGTRNITVEASGPPDPASLSTTALQSDGRTIHLDFDAGNAELVENDAVSGITVAIRQGLDMANVDVTALVAGASLHRLVVSLPATILPGQDVYVTYTPGNLMDEVGAVSGFGAVRATNNSTVAIAITGMDLDNILQRVNEKIRAIREGR